jgi:hypothetical protein
MTQIRRLDIIWQGEEVSVYEALKKQAQNENSEIQDKRIIKKTGKIGGTAHSR